MFAEAQKHRGFDINIEMLDGKFLGSYHDPLWTGQRDQWKKLPDAEAHETLEGAHANARRYLDRLLQKEGEEIAKDLSHYGRRVE